MIIKKKYNYLQRILLIVIVFQFLSCSKKDKISHGEDVMFMKTINHTSNYSSEPIVNKPSLLWKLKTNGQVISSPVVNNKVVYIGSEDFNLYAIDAISGKLIWKFITNGAISSTPTVSKGKVMFLSMDGYFYCLNQEDGKLIWKFKTGGESKYKVKDYYNLSFQPDFWGFYLSSAVVNDNLVYFGSSDSYIYALNIETGENIWKYKTEASIHSSPAIYNNSLVIGSWDSNIYCLNATTGVENWKFSTGKDKEYYVMMGIQASPSIDSNMTFIGSRDAKMYALNTSTGDTIWTNKNFNGSWMPSSAAIGKDYIYTGSSDAFRFYSIDKFTGEINYSTNTKAYTFSSPAIDSEMAYIGSANGRLYGINITKGDIKWEFKTEGIKNDTIKMFNPSGEMNKERITSLTKDFANMKSLSLFYNQAFINSGAILSTPTISNQVIYFGSSDGYVYAITDKVN